MVQLVRTHASRLVQLYVGLWLYGLGAALQLRSGLGLDPWDVFHQGLSRHVGLAIGTVLILVGLVVLIAWIPLRQRPGLGTISNVVLIGVSLNVSLEMIGAPHAMAARVGLLAGGIALGGMATGMYIGAHYGPGPRDGLMTGLSRRTGRSIRLVRTCIEVSVLVAGFFLGGSVGIGTVAYAVSIGPLAQVFLKVFDRSTPDDAAGPVSRPRRRGRARSPGVRRRSRTRDARRRRPAAAPPAIRR